MRFFKRKKSEINSSSMADIAFLLLIFFLITTTIQTNKGLNATLPPCSEVQETIDINDRNVYKIHINSLNNILVEDAPFESFSQMKTDVHSFILNYGKNPALSDSPQDAVVSLHMNRGTHYKRFIEVMDAVQGVYFDIYGERVGLSAGQYRNLDLKIPDQKTRYEEGRAGIPMNISIAEPYKTQ
ncbi:MAG: biopolymer transporter ExbD [Cyclobacteriaceae bacterium]|nr:biopolymer transporter ExbD [Cyclobacteriaceae bacterium]